MNGFNGPEPYFGGFKIRKDSKDPNWVQFGHVAFGGYSAKILCFIPNNLLDTAQISISSWKELCKVD